MKASFSAPATIPVTLANLRLHMKVPGDVPGDTELTALLNSAWNEAAEWAKLSFITRTVTLSVDSHEIHSGTIWLPYGPVQSITSLTAYDADNNSTLIASTNYLLDGDELFEYSNGFTSDVGRATKGLVIVYEAGFGDADTDIPADVSNAIKQRTNDLYLFRQSALSGERVGGTPAEWQSLLAGRRHLALI